MSGPSSIPSTPLSEARRLLRHESRSQMYESRSQLHSNAGTGTVTPTAASAAAHGHSHSEHELLKGTQNGVSYGYATGAGYGSLNGE